VSHVEGVTELPACFELIGEGQPCRVQAIRLRGKPVWGVQFHPEREPSDSPDGAPSGRRRGDGDRLLAAFLREAGLVRGEPDRSTASTPPL
jgi:GMP synthase-like glutamine amidotransferase